jgi:hypothetical protein
MDAGMSNRAAILRIVIGAFCIWAALDPEARMKNAETPYGAVEIPKDVTHGAWNVPDPWWRLGVMADALN